MTAGFRLYVQLQLVVNKSRQAHYVIVLLGIIRDDPSISFLLSHLSPTEQSSSILDSNALWMNTAFSSEIHPSEFQRCFSPYTIRLWDELTLESTQWQANLAVLVALLLTCGHKLH